MTYGGFGEFEAFRYTRVGGQPDNPPNPPYTLRTTALIAAGHRPRRNGMTPHGGEMKPAPCDALKCKDTADRYRHGTYCPRHARMMAPRSQWEQLGVLYPDGQEPPPRPPVPVLTGPVRARLGGLDVIYAPCPEGCGRPACYLPGQAIPPCLGCEVTAHHQQRKEPA